MIRSEGDGKTERKRPRLTDLNGYHEVLVKRVEDFARAAGWRAIAMTYHNQDGGDALKLAGDNTGLYVRTLPDLVFTNGQRTILVEVKTHLSDRYSDATPELFPIVVARALWYTVGVRTLYVYEDPLAGISAAWWGHEVFEEVPVTAIYVGTQRPEYQELAALVRCWQRSWLIPADVPVKTVQTNGSGDPYVVIPERVLRNLLPWHVVLGDALGR
jgi:hypothetical protein